jgi:hypothetical protein
MAGNWVWRRMAGVLVVVVVLPSCKAIFIDQRGPQQAVDAGGDDLDLQSVDLEPDLGDGGSDSGARDSAGAQ